MTAFSGDFYQLQTNVYSNFENFQAQSDIEWKFGLSKLIRSMHRTTTAPSPINLITTWLFYLVDMCKARSMYNIDFKLKISMNILEF